MPNASVATSREIKTNTQSALTNILSNKKETCKLIVPSLCPQAMRPQANQGEYANEPNQDDG